jgi:hypothetical protein
MKKMALVFLPIYLGDTGHVEPWTEKWWESMMSIPTTTTSKRPPNKSGVAVRIRFPPDGAIVRNAPEWGDVVPEVDVSLQEGPFAGQIRSKI